MSEGANSVPQICENSLTTLKDEVDPEELPPRTVSHTTRRVRFGTGNVPLSPYILIDGRKLRSSLALSKKKTPRRVSFPTNDNHLITGYLEPENPWKLAENVSCEDIIKAYKESCIKHNSNPMETVISQLENLDASELRNNELNLKNEVLDVDHAEPLEEIFKRIQFNKVDLEATSLNDESSVILFDMLEYYESVKHLNISSNQSIGVHGWQACANMIRKTQCLEHLEANDVILNEQYMNILSRAFRLVCHLHVLKLENCGLSGRSIVTLVSALKMNTGIRELYLADNGLNLYDAIQLGSLLRLNNHIQLLDISNNVIQDDGVRDILEGLINQINEDKDGKGLNILVLWNNQLTKKSSPYFARIIGLSKTLETLNIGKNTLTDELLFIIKDSLKKNRVLLQLGIQSTEITCDGIATLSEVIEINQTLQRVDLRNNIIQLNGIKRLSLAMKKNRSITKIDLDDDIADTKLDDLTQSLNQYMQFVTEIRSRCLENVNNRSLEGNNEGFENSYHNRFCSTTSRKISLTCQTLPCSLSSTITIQKDDTGRSMLEPKRINGGHLRSPAPSPASSPVASPILCPSRSRFVVSRVPETFRSAESSVVLRKSHESSPTCVTTASGPSRFRVSIVESANNVSITKPVVTTSEDDVRMINTKPEVHITKPIGSNDSDNVFGFDLEMDNDKTECSQSTSDDVFHLVTNVVKEVCTTSSTERSNVEELKSTFVREIDGTKSDETTISSNEVTSNQKENVDFLDNQIMTTNSSNKNVECNSNDIDKQDTNTLKAATIVKLDVSSSYTNDKSSITNKDNDTINKIINVGTKESIELQSQTKHDPIQKSTSNLGKLLSLFQNSSCFFSDTTSVGQLRSKTTLQGSINSVMTLGDKFHYYIKNKKDRINSREAEESSLSLKNKSKFFNVSQLPSLQSLANIIPSFKFDGTLSASERDDNKTDCSEETNLVLEKKNTEMSRENDKLNVYLEKENNSISVKNDDPLPEDIQFKFPAGVTNKDILLAASCIVSNIIDTCSKIVNDNLLTHVSNSNTIVPVPKLIGIPEYSALKAGTNDAQSGDITSIQEKVNRTIIKKRTNDKTLTNSINFPSDNSLSCNIMTYSVRKDARTSYTSDKVHNLVILNLSTNDNVGNSSAANVNSTDGDTACFLCNGKCACNVNSKLHKYNTELKVKVKMNCLHNKVTRMYSIDSNSDQNVVISDCNVTSDKVENVNVNDNMKLKNAAENSVEEEKTWNVDSSDEDDSLESPNNSSKLPVSRHSECVCKLTKQSTINKFVTKNNRYLKISDVCTENVNNYEVERSVNNIFENINAVKSRPRLYTYITNFNMYTLRSLIHHVADISINGSPIRQMSLEITPNNWPNDIIKRRILFYDVSQVPERITNDIIKWQQSTNTEVMQKCNTSGFTGKEKNLNKEFEHDGNIIEIDSEHSVSSSKIDFIVQTDREVSYPINTNDACNNTSGNTNVNDNFGSNVAQLIKCINSNDKNDMTDQYINAIECTVATTMCSTVTINTKGDKTIDNFDQSTNTAEPSSVVLATSTK